MLAIVDGDDTLQVQRTCRQLREAADPDGLNTSVLDDARLTIAEIIQAADAIPFFGGQRCVVVRGLLYRLGRSSERTKGAGREAALAELADYLPRLPATTTLIFWEPAPIKLSTMLEQSLPTDYQRHSFVAPTRPGDLQSWFEGWLTDRANELAVRITRDAVARLATTAVESIRSGDGPERDLRTPIEIQRLDNELQKLAAFAGPEGRIDGRIVANLTPDPRTQVFALVDAVAIRATPRALGLLERALAEGGEPMALLRLIDRQISNLLRAAATGGTAREIASQLRLPDWLARKYAQQATSLGSAGLRQAHHRLLQADYAIKTGRATPEAALRDAVLALCLG